jgi:hypothetical protein
MNASPTHVIVFAVNILSFKKYHVKSGNVKYDKAKIKNRGPHISPISAYAICIPYQKHRDAGSVNTNMGNRGLSFHHSHTN